MTATRAGGAPVLVGLGLMLGPAAALGLARFAYALLLPAMRAQLGWSLTTAGALTTANAFGYLLGAPLAAVAAHTVGERRSFLAAIAGTAVVLAATAATDALWLLLVLRFAAGIGGAVCFVVGAGIAARAGASGSPTRATLLLGVYFAGAGAGIVMSGLVVPVVVAHAGWRVSWLVLAGLAVLALAGAWPAARAVPEPTGHPSTGADRGRPRFRTLAALITSYGLYGAGYIAYMTFIVANLQGTGASVGEIAVFWSLLGAAAVVGAFCWAPVLPALSARAAMVLALLVVGAGTALPVVLPGLAATLVSAVLFGVSFLTVITTVTGAAGRALPAHQLTTAVAVLTTAFALGQCAGPILSGAASSGPAGIRLGLGVGAVLLLVAAIVALFHRPRELSA